MRILIQKFGGALLGTKESYNQIIHEVAQAQTNGYRVVVVVSAIGRAGDPYATDTLLELANAIQPGIDSQTCDLLVSCGETISAALLAHALTRNAFKAIALTGTQTGILTTNEFGNARIINIQPQKIIRALERGYVPVVAGFQGATLEGVITTLGRGGSDTTAVALGVALGAERVVLYKEAAGVMVCDPCIIPEAALIPRLTYDHLHRMAHLGAQVVSLRAVELAQEHNIRLLICQPGGKVGTEVVNPSADDRIHYNHEAISLVHLPDVQLILLNPESANSSKRRECLQWVLRIINQAALNADSLHMNTDQIVAVLRGKSATHLDTLLSETKLSFKIFQSCARIALITADNANIPTITMRMMQALESAGINVFYVSATANVISIILKQNLLQKAMAELHSTLLLSHSK